MCCVYMHVYIWRGGEKERERERERDTLTWRVLLRYMRFWVAAQMAFQSEDTHTISLTPSNSSSYNNKALR